jgi:hypothetical protein
VGTLPLAKLSKAQMSATSNPLLHRRPWLRIVVRSLILLMILLAAAGFLFENISETREQRFNPPPGRLVDVGGYKMHLHCTGQGSPVVVLDAGLGDSYVSWRKVQPEIAKLTTVCSYDRAGLGFSDASPHPRTSKIIAEELHTLLHNAGVAFPVILVGHSMGGYDVRLFASLYRHAIRNSSTVGLLRPRFSAPRRRMQLSQRT